MNEKRPPEMTHLQNAFWTSSSTWAVTTIRLAIIILYHSGAVKTSIPHSWLHSPSLTSILIKPAWTLTHVREALAVQHLVSGHFADAFRANRIQLPPLLLAAITPLVQSTHSDIYWAILCLLLDFGMAVMIESLGLIALFTNRVEAVDVETIEQEQLPEAIRPPHSHVFAINKQEDLSKALISMESLPLLAAQLYYWSPATALSGSVYGCFQNLPGFFLVATFWEAVRRGGSLWLSTFFLALAAYLELHHIVFLLPLVALPRSRSMSIPVLISFSVWYGSLHGLSYLLVGPMLEQVLQATYGVGWRIIRPSLSIQWYLAMQLFSRFRDYFGALLLGLPYIVVIPISVRLFAYPMVLVAIFSMIWTIFRPVETLWDANLSLSLFLLCPRSLARMGTIAFLSVCSMGVPVVLNVVDHWMWLGPNTGNANYMFFQCLAYNVFLGILLGQFVKGSLERHKALRITEKERVGS